MKYNAFARPEDLCAWLKKNHKTRTELWVRIFKKGSGQPSVSWNDCVVEAIAWGWIDGLRRSLDDVSYLQRLTPRKPKSNWSKRNKEHAERLISEGRMQPPGLLHVERAKQDERWGAAYEGSAGMKMPEDFLESLRKHKNAMRFYSTLDRRNLHSIYLQITTAKKPETRARRILKIILKLSRAEKFY